MDKKTLTKYLDFANHHQEATPEDIKKLCEKVRHYGFHSAFVNSCYISLARELLGGKAVVGTVISFPLGQDLRDTKVFSAIESVRRGADELDVSMNIGLFKARKDKEVLAEMEAIVNAVKEIERKRW